MKKYNTILFDVDDTILDFKKGEKTALNELFKEMNILNEKNIMDDYNIINQSLWRDLEMGKVTREYVLNNRFFLLFNKYNKVVDGKEIESRYRYHLNLQHQLIDGANELLLSLSQDYRLFVITNGVSKTQYKRLKDAKLEQYFEKIFVSEDIGFQKPMKEYFDTVISEIPNFQIKTTLIVGDSLTADILGGIQANIDTCWFNPNMKVNDTNIKPTYEVNKLSDLYKILNENSGDGRLIG